MDNSLGEPEDIIWQQRLGRPSNDYEDALALALDRIFGEGVDELEGIVSRLNELGITSAEGAPWTTDSFQSEMAKLGAKEF